jgi:protein-glutamine gamma-glutamyltransferase
MQDKAREIELLLLTMLAAVPLYATQTVSAVPLLMFHGFMAAMVIRVALGHSPELVPEPVMKALGIGYIIFYIVDAALISRNAIAASTHLVLFIAVYQPIESRRRPNTAQRLLTTSLIFVASIATATHIAIVPFVIVFAFLLFRQLIHLSHSISARTVDAPATDVPATRAAGFYVCGTTLIGVLLFPLLPRVRNPLVPGFLGSNAASTGLSDTINFNEQRNITADPAVVSRVWMGQEAVPFFTPLRLRGAVYERFRDNEWLPGRHDFSPLDSRDGAVQIARPAGFDRQATVQQRFILAGRLFLPVGTYEIIGLPQVYQGPTRDIYTVWQIRRDILTYDVRMARSITPLTVRRVAPSNYPVTPRVAAMAHQIVGDEQDSMRQAGKIETYLSMRFQYIPNPAQIGHTMSVDDFLLRERRGHCEYFAAGMVALLTALNVPARIVGGFYGGKLNPLTGYFVIRREDAHAWVEVFDGDGWRTFDPTPAGLRPGASPSGLLGAYASAVGDSVNYFWDRYILTFGLADQIALAVDAIGRMRQAFAALNAKAQHTAGQLLTLRALAAAAAGAAIAFAALWLVYRRRAAFDLLRDHLQILGIDVGPSMTMEEALAELRRKQTEAAAALAPLIALYEEERFSPRESAAREMIRRRLAQIKV